LTRSRHGDVVLERSRPRRAGAEWALIEVVDWIDDVGESVRDFDRRLAALDRLAVAKMREDDPPVVSGAWLLRATTRNRRLLADHRHFFRGRFPSSSHAWLAALTHRQSPLPREAAIVWVNVAGTRIFAARLAGQR
jgi:hypothetical protein